MPLYDVRRKTVLRSSVVEAVNETEARFKARDVWQQDAAIVSLSAEVVRIAFTEDNDGDLLSELRYEETDRDRESELTERLRREDYRESP